MKEAKKVIKTLQKAYALASSPNQTEAYKKLHPECSELTASSNASKYFKDVKDVQDLTGAISKMPTAQPILENILRCYWYVFSECSNSKRYDVAISALKEISKLCPEFAEKHQFNIFNKMNDQELDQEIKNLMTGLNLKE